MKKVLFGAAVLGACAAAHADFVTGFEAPEHNASAAGTSLTGQQGWTLPAGIDQHVFTYENNALGFVQNPVGGNQFIGRTSGGGTNFARGQHLVDFSAGGQFTISYDMAAIASGATSTANLSSFSLQDSVTQRSYINLNNFVNLNDPSQGWKAEFNVFNAAGVAQNNQSPGAAFTGLANNHWYRLYTTVDFATNLITSVTIADLHTGASTTANPTGWYLTGGANPTAALPTAVRFFTGGNTSNTMGWDNLNVIPSPASLSLLGAGMLIAGRRRRA